MPFIHIKSLPFQEPLDMPSIIEEIAGDFSEKTGIEPRHVHTTWEYFMPRHYAKGGEAPEYQPDAHHPLIVDLLTPDFNDSDTIAVMLETLAESISKRVAFPKNNIFINHRQAHSGRVFDDGKIVHW